MSDEVSQFLESVERLRGQQIEEDEVRARELEEYLAAKRERQARRQERARSISPQKSSPANTPSPRSSRQSVRLTEGPRLDSPAAQTTPTGAGRTIGNESRGTSVDPEADASTMRFPLSSPSKENEAPADSDPDGKRSGFTPPARSSTLSWQRRPTSRGGTRPLSMVAAQNATQRSLVGSQEPQSATETSFSRDQISQNLASKDPSWFRQTAERGKGSAAYRKNQVEDEDRSDVSAGSAQLPGMSDSLRDRTPSATDTATSTPKGLASPLPLASPHNNSFGENDMSIEEALKSPVGNASPTRSPSPTKGMGGFVQSAMMKRTDSVKRWSVQSPPGLTRVDSVTSNRGNFRPSRPMSFARSDSKTPVTSRPTSQHGEEQSPEETTPKAIDTKPSPDDKSADGDEAIAISPSKTMDPRRWSPTKSSWLDSALKKPESPKPQMKPFVPPQPSWKADLNKNKAERANTPTNEHARAGSVSHKHQVSIGGLMRSTPMGAGVKTNTADLGGIYSPPARGNRPEFGHATKPSLSKTATSTEPSSPEEKGPETPASNENPELKATEAVADPPSRSSIASPPAPKPKPETPPKKDFRSGLKSRPVDSGPARADEPEFKNALGNLRRAKTQNYVAPDELKSNIMRGKAALAATGGPQKTERVDEFKDAILKRKDDFKKVQAEGKGITRTPTVSASRPLPEGLARRAELGKPIGWKKEASPNQNTAPKKPDSPKPIPAPKRIISQSIASPKSPSIPSPSVASPPPVEAPKRTSTEPQSASAAGSYTLPTLQKEISAPSKLQGRLGGKLADRFNPALAGMLARGPPPAVSEGGKEPSQSASGASTGIADAGEIPAPGPQLTHMTKGRARGPRRKAPSSTPGAQKASSQDAISQPAPKLQPEAAKEPTTRMPMQKDEPKSGNSSSPIDEVQANGSPPEAKVAPQSVQEQVAARATLRGRPSPIQVAGENIGQTRSLPFRRQPSSPQKSITEPISHIKPHKTGGDISQPGSPKKLDVKRMSRFLDDSAVNGSKAELAQDPPRLKHQRTGSRSPAKFDRFEAQPPASTPKLDSSPSEPVQEASSRFRAAAKSPQPAPKPSFDSLKKPTGPRTPSQSHSSARTMPVSPVDDLKSPTVEPSARPLPSTPGIKSSPAIDSPARSPSKQASDTSTLLSDFFGPDRPKKDYKVDPAELLIAPFESSGKINTLNVQMFQISGDGKKVPVMSHNEHTLYEQEMYICTHQYTNEAGWKKSAAYFWAGDDVSESVAEDAQLFAQQDAKLSGGKLVRIPQGRETSEFLQALGGAVVTRRGSSNRYDPLAPTMLCGRRHLGQVVFDEVDFTSASLCAGFPYLIAHDGKCYLWKGKGSNIEELSCAKLIGTELTPTGELTEYEEGNEPASFWDIFESGAKPHSADHWRLKPKYGKYGSRLFCSDADSRHQIFEISPFNQGDLSPLSIYVLDAFFEMYIVVGSRAQSQFASFRNALNFAQEYAILAASMEDRPFVPISTVVLQGVPRDLKRVFRKWSDEKSPTVTKVKSDLRRGGSLRVVPLTQALQALSE